MSGSPGKKYALHRNIRVFGAGGYQLFPAIAIVFCSRDFRISEQHVVHVFDHGYSAFMHLVNTFL